MRPSTDKGCFGSQTREIYILTSKKRRKKYKASIQIERKNTPI